MIHLKKTDPSRQSVYWWVEEWRVERLVDALRLFRASGIPIEKLAGEDFDPDEPPKRTSQSQASKAGFGLAALSRSMLRTLHELQRLQAARTGKHVPAPAVVDVDVSLPESPTLDIEGTNETD